MSGKTKIEWADRVWNPVVGFTPVTAGCAHCYAKRMYERFYQDKPFSKVQPHPERLELPWKWLKPQRVFVNSMSDLFHDDVSDNFIWSVFSVMAVAEKHTFMVLTKRPERMREYLSHWEHFFSTDFHSGPGNTFLHQWPLPNVQMGVSVSSEQDLWMVEELMNTPAAVRFVSVEPMLGAVDLRKWMMSPSPLTPLPRAGEGKLDWVICGGESGPGARPMDPDWVRGLRDQCLEAKAPFFFKSWGEWRDESCLETKQYKTEPYYTKRMVAEINGKKFFRVGKAKAGNMLDGRTWNEFPGKRNQEEKC